MTSDDQKQAAGEAAAQLVQAGMIVGLGTGSTAAWFVKALAARGLDVRGVPTSLATAELAKSLGIELVERDSVDAIDLTVDGADEIGPGLALIKGGGAALLREKLVWEASRRCVVIADAANARAACAEDRGYSGIAQPGFIMRWQGADLTRLPQPLLDRMASGRYHKAAVGSCPTGSVEGSFTAYRLAVLLY